MGKSCILVVEDHPVSRSILDAMLKKAYRVVAAASGPEALEQARDEKPDLVLLDVEIPGMDGFQVLERLRQGIIDAAVPVIFLTAREDSESRDRGLAAGAVDYITKPYDKPELLIKVKNHLALYEARKEIERTNRIMAVEMEMASQLQRALLPQSFPSDRRLRFLVDYRPSSKASGDFYDVVEMPRDDIGFVQVDVAGHGVHSAMIGAMFKMAFQTLSRECTDPSNLISIINDEMCSLLPDCDFLSVFYGVINRKTLQLAYTNAGHPRPFLYRKESDDIVVLKDGGPLVGAFPNMAFEEGTLEVFPGDRMLLFTDGIVEASQAGMPRELYGVDRLRQAFAEGIQLSPSDAMEVITADLEAFRGGTAFEDDISLMLISVD
jgi:serine phosphatase RsbU (regulator of sigma subunit)